MQSCVFMCFNIELVEETAPMPSTWLPLSFRFIVNVGVLDQWCWWYGALAWWRVFLVGGGAVESEGHDLH